MTKYNKYTQFKTVEIKERDWPNNSLDKCPIWCLVDLRDGNQALAEPMDSMRKMKFFKKYLKNSDQFNINENTISAIITPDKDIVPGSKNLKPAFIVFNNYEKILKWNRSLRFALAVCTLKNKFKNEI